MKTIINLIILVVIWSFVGKIKANNIDFSHLSVENGLSNNFIKTIYKDKFGYVWFGTLDGLNRYDGWEVRVFNQYFPDKTGSVTSIVSDNYNKLWIGTETGLYYWDRVSTKFNQFEHDILKDTKVGKLLLVSNQLFVSTNAGFFSINILTGTTDKLSFHKKIGSVFNNIPDYLIEDDQMFIASDKGLIQYDINSKSSIIYDNINREIEVEISYSSITKVGDTVYLGTYNQGLLVFNLGNRSVNRLNSFKKSIILTITKDVENVYVGTDSDGLKVLNINDGNIESFENKVNQPNSISSNAIYSLLKDQDGYLWVGTHSGGVNFASFEERFFKTFDIKDLSTIANSSVRSIKFCDSIKFIGTRNGLYVYNVNTKKVRYFEQDDKSLKGRIVLNMHNYKGSVLVGTYGRGISEYSLKDGSLKPWKEDVFKGVSVYSFDEDDQGNLWIGTLNGLYRIDSEENIINFNSNNSELIDNWIYTIKIDNLNRLWVGTMYGVALYKINGNIISKYSNVETVVKARIPSIYQDSKNIIWVSTEKFGCYALNSKLELLHHLSEQTGLCNNSVSAVIEGDSDTYWITTLKGLGRFDKKKNEITNYYHSKGLPGLVFSPEAAIKDKDGSIWLGNEKGLVYFNPLNLTEEDKLPKIALTDLYVGGKSLNLNKKKLQVKPIELLDTLVLEGENNNIGFRFVDLSSIESKDKPFWVKLEYNGNIHSDWLNLNGQNSIFYSGLKPGEYAFYIGYNSGDNNIVKNSIKKVVIRIRSEWYQSIAVLIGLIAFFVILIAYINYTRRRVKRLVYKLKEKKSDDKKYEGSRLDLERSKKLYNEIETYVEESKVFLNLELKISDIANSLGYTTHEISQAINQNKGQGFTDFINYFRVEEVKRKVNDPEYIYLTLPAIAEKCGFNSKSSFYRAFKKVTGKTPASYFTRK